MRIGRDFAGRQLLGTRKLQEDSYAFSIIAGGEHDVEKLLVVIADGLGGHACGQRASQIAVEAFIAEFFQHKLGVDTDDSFALHEALMYANESIGKAIEEANGELNGMGTTLLAATVSHTAMQWISVGDSPLLLFRNRKLKRLNADHSMRPFIAEGIADGRLAQEAMATHPQRNVICSALLGEDIPAIDASAAPFALHPGDILLFATDGLQVLSESTLTARLAKSAGLTAPQLTRSLISSIEDLKNPKQDNATVAVVLQGE